jgi:fumarate hydratase class II
MRRDCLNSRPRHAVGTASTRTQLGRRLAEQLSELTHVPFKEARNHFAALAPWIRR